MPAVRHCARIDTFALKIQMETKLGSQKSEKYFSLLTRYLNLKVAKSEFDKLCVCLIGRENIRLHNELIRSILKNATVVNTPPPKQVKHDNLLTLNGSLQSICRDVFPQSPRKGRTPNLRNRPSSLGFGLNDKNQTVSLTNKPLVEVNNHKRIPITPPFGINIHADKTQKVSHKSSCYTETCYYNGHLQSTSYLEKRLKQKNKLEGLDISMDCVNLLNNGLNSYLKRIIKPSLELASSRSLHTPETKFTTSLLEIQMATMTNPKILGEDQLEKICLFGFENK